MIVKYQIRSNQIIYLGILITGFIWVAINLLTSGTSATICLLKNTTGISCPTCGITDSILFFLSGDFQSSFMANPIGIPFAFMLLGIGLSASRQLVFKRRSIWQLFESYERWIKNHIIFIYAGLLILLLNWIFILIR